jgi:hypothetical protein
VEWGIKKSVFSTDFKTVHMTLEKMHPKKVSAKKLFYQLKILKVGFGTEFRSENSERFPLFRGRKCSFRSIPSSAEEPIPKLENGRGDLHILDCLVTTTVTPRKTFYGWRRKERKAAAKANGLL